ncbi:MAG: GNAT family N-acetyltransferase [Proteobacteria bacterium]|nr:GNAT family N-acetyltransferase [Pseudomonadota bacterium]
MSKKISPEDITKIIQPGSRIFIGTGCSEPTILTQQLVSHKHYFTDCEILHFLTLSENNYFDSQQPSPFRHQALFVGKSIRQAVNEGKADYIPISLSDIPRLVKSGRLRIDVALLQVSPPAKFGFCSLGINVDINRTVFECAKIVIAQINPLMPRTSGDSFVRFADIDYYVEHEAPLLEFTYPEPDEATEKIGRYCARLIENGSTLQLGIGAIPNAVLRHLGDKSDLAIFSEVLSDSVIDLIEAGNVNCRKNIHPHVMISFVIGSKRLYDYVNDNPFIEFHPTSVINNLANIAANSKMVSMNAALSVSLTGQVNSDSIGTHFYSGVGGQLDFTKGAALSEGGKPIICLPSLTHDGKKSRIVATLEPGSGVVVPRSDVHYVVTEWGVAYLHGKSIRERVMLMIGIAHPKFRKDLLEEAKKLHFAYEDQMLPQTKDGVVVVYPEKFEWKFTTRDQVTVFFRPVKPTDERMLQDLYYELDQDDRKLRFFSPKSTFSHEETQSAVNVDYESVFVLVGLGGEADQQKIVSIGSYYLDRPHNQAEIAFTVTKEYRNQGLTRFMLHKLIDVAREKGVAGFNGEVLKINDAMLNILKTLPYKIYFESEEDYLHFQFHFDQLKKDFE